MSARSQGIGRLEEYQIRRGKKHVPAPKRRVVSIVREARNEFDTARVLLACGHQIESRAQIGRATGCPKCAKERTK